jgi:hypothetical protein
MQDIPVFIGGFRSGTTLLINLLGLHPQITPWFETREVCEAVRWQHVLAQPAQASFESAYCAPSEPGGFSPAAVYQRMLQQARDTNARTSGGPSGKAAHERYPVGDDYVRYTLDDAESLLKAWYTTCSAQPDAGRVAAANGTLIRALGAMQQRLHGGGPWINKTPEITRFAGELRAALGTCRMIYMVRDGIQVVASGYRLGWGSIEALAFNWKGLLERTRAAMQECPQDYLELRYEELVREPVATLDRVLRFCGRDATGSAIVTQFSADAGKGAFDVSRLQGNDSLDAGQLRIFAAVAGDMQAALGYAAPPFSGSPLPRG